ncbi:MAG: hypothetical protein HQM10_21005 [Candidatus Riflebacteria bacterium]|nr:hypothetical protein [Candidatus Riflebacteria bacterium]
MIQVLFRNAFSLKFFQTCLITSLTVVFMLFTFISAFAADESPGDLKSALNIIFNIPDRLESVESAFKAYLQISPSELPSGNLYEMLLPENQPLQNPVTIISDSVPGLADEVIFDYIQATRKDFISYSGGPTEFLSRDQFSKIVSDGRLPVNIDPYEYFQLHDRNSDQKLSMPEFIPSPSEVALKQNLSVLQNAYLNNTSYPNGQQPVSSPSNASQTVTASSTKSPAGNIPAGAVPPKEISILQIENRIQNFADKSGNRTIRDPEGKLIVIDKFGNPIPLPPGIIPPRVEFAVTGLRTFASKISGIFERLPGGEFLLKDSKGKPVPPNEWPVEFRPPYFPSNAPPPPGPGN